MFGSRPRLLASCFDLWKNILTWNDGLGWRLSDERQEIEPTARSVRHHLIEMKGAVFCGLLAKCWGTPSHSSLKPVRPVGILFVLWGCHENCPGENYIVNGTKKWITGGMPGALERLEGSVKLVNAYLNLT